MKLKKKKNESFSLFINLFFWALQGLLYVLISLSVYLSCFISLVFLEERR